MLKKILFMLLTLSVLLAAAACGPTKILHCDDCGAEVKVPESSNMEEDWIVLCEDCNDVTIPE